MKRTGTIVGILVLIVAIVVAAWDWNWFKGVIADRVRDRTGRDLVIEGDIDVDLSLTPTVRVRDIRFENAAWSDRGDMLSIGELSFRIALPALLRGRLVLPEVHLAAPAVLLEKAASGDANWALDYFRRSADHRILFAWALSRDVRARRPQGLDLLGRSGARGLRAGLGHLRPQFGAHPRRQVITPARG